VTGTDKALVKDRFFGGHMDEIVAYAEGFTKEFQKARVNSGGLPKNRKGIPEDNLAMEESANAVIPESEKQVKEYCEKAGAAQRQNLAAWMAHLDKAGGLYQPALDMVHRAASGGQSLPKRKP
jgi:hypothetical protein